MSALRQLLVLFLFTTAAHAATIRGVVRDAAGQPLAGATVSLAGQRDVLTDAAGAFAFEVPSGAYTLRVTRDGYQSETRSVAAGEAVDVALRPVLAEAIVVSGIRAEEKTPVTKTDVTRDEIERRYSQQDIPLLLRDTPGVNAYTESGIGGSGYSYITLRGVSPTRINFTLDGVPLADSEDMGTYFADFPDLARSLQSIQIQRGVGTSTVGSPSFGGSINLQSIDLAHAPSTGARVAVGSYGTRFATLGWQSGVTPGGFAIYSRLSVNKSDGYREHSGVDQHNLFVSAIKQNERSQLKITGFTAHEKQQMSFNATDLDTLKLDRRANPLAPEERDSFGYDLAQLQYLRALGDHANMTASAYYQRGYGWYRLFDDNVIKSDLRQYGLDGMLIGSMVTMSVTRGAMTASYGLHVNEFRREHTRDLLGDGRDYANEGRKREANAFAKVSADRGRWHTYGDAQLRWTDFHYSGDVKIEPIHWTFFNPKLGARYDVAPSSSVYASAGLSTREPTRNDLFQGEDNASFAHDLHAVKPERLFDVEVGWEYHTPRTSVAANVYAMQFRNEIAATGELSDIGLALRRNVDRSYRRGIELDAAWQALPSLRLRTNANVSRNRIRTWTQFYDVYDENGNFQTTRALVHHDVHPLLTPEVIVSQAVDYTPSGRLSFGAVGRYVAKSYLDNTNNGDFTTPSFFDLDANVSVAVARALRVSLQVNNALNSRRILPSGYSYQYFVKDALNGISYFYPQATRNAVIMLDWKL